MDRDWITSGERRRKGFFVQQFLTKREVEYQKELEERRKRLRLLFEEERKQQEKELTLRRERRKEGNAIARNEQARKMRMQEEENRMVQVKLTEEQRERERCPFYRENLSKEIEASISASRDQEIQLKSEIRKGTAYSLLNDKHRLKR